jgi:transcription antitermination factor NusG
MRHKVDELWTPIIVPDRDMASFIRVSGSKEERIVYLDPAKLNFKKGDKVRVIGGPMTGVEGTFMQIGGKHEKRVVIQIENLIAVATAAIPAAMVEKIG